MQTENRIYLESSVPAAGGTGGGSTAGGTTAGTTERFPKLFTDAATATGVPKEEKVCYLTFDDGPSKNTPRVLELLRKYNAKATFFVVGNNIYGERAATLQQAVKEGHAIGIHGYTHEYKALYESEDSFLKDYEKMAVFLRENFDIEANMFRFPGGSNCTYLKGSGKRLIAEMHRRGYRCFDWNVSGEDSVGTPTVESVLNNVYRDVFRYNHPVILLHDSAQTDVTVEALELILARLAKEGYRFESLEHAQEYIFPQSRQ